MGTLAMASPRARSARKRLREEDEDGRDYASDSEPAVPLSDPPASPAVQQPTAGASQPNGAATAAAPRPPRPHRQLPVGAVVWGSGAACPPCDLPPTCGE